LSFPSSLDLGLIKNLTRHIPPSIYTGSAINFHLFNERSLYSIVKPSGFSPILFYQHNSTAVCPYFLNGSAKV
jgi:hypothetical protein